MARRPERTDLSRVCLQLPRATRSSRERQLQSLVAEFCQLSFDLVDPSEQAALTRRMLSFLLFLENRLPYWDSSTESAASQGSAAEPVRSSARPQRLEEKAYRLLGISDDDMRAIERLSDSAGKQIEANKYRAAYEELCAARLRLTAAPSRACPMSDRQILDDQDPRHFEHIVQAQLRHVCTKDQACTPVPESSCDGDFAEASTADELSDRDTEAEQHHTFILEERASKLESNDTRLVKRKKLPLGDFAFILLPKRFSQKKNCSGFRVARGLCNVQVKKCSGAAADVELRVLLREGGRPIIIKHDFRQSLTCEIEEFVDLRKLVDVAKGTFSVHFSLISRSS